MTGVCFPDRMVKLIFYQANTGNSYCGQHDHSDTARLIFWMMSFM